MINIVKQNKLTLFLISTTAATLLISATFFTISKSHSSVTISLWSTSSLFIMITIFLMYCAIKNNTNKLKGTFDINNT